MEVSALWKANAQSPIDVTPAGITTAPAHEDPLDTTPAVIVKFGVAIDWTPVVQR